MENALLIDNKYKKWGIVILLPSLVLGAFYRFADFGFDFLTIEANGRSIFNETVNFTDEIALTGTIIGLLLIAFSREKVEDEYISRMRLESLQWAVLINYALLLIASWAVHGLAYIDVMVYNMLTVLIIFIVRFHYVLRKNNTEL